MMSDDTTKGETIVRVLIYMADPAQGVARVRLRFMRALALGFRVSPIFSILLNLTIYL
jgi:hypothetical protein